MRLFVSSTGASHEYIEVIVISYGRLHFSGLGGTLTYLFLLFHLLSKLSLYQLHFLGSILCAGSNTECHHIIIMLSACTGIQIVSQLATVLLRQGKWGHRAW
jgi:hypothetical protein